MNKYYDPEISNTGTTYSWTGKDTYGEFNASVFIPNRPENNCVLIGKYLDGSRTIKREIPFGLLEGMWRLRHMAGMRVTVVHPDEGWSKSDGDS